MKFVLLVVMVGLCSVANASGSISHPKEKHKKECREDKGKIDIDFSFNQLPPDGTGTTGTYITVSWHASNSSVRQIYIYESDDMTTYGNLQADYAIEKGSSGSHVMLPYKETGSGTHYVWVVDEKGRLLDYATYEV